MTAGADVVVEHLSKRYGEHITALVDVSFHVRAGELVLLTGRSGSGKSTILNLVAGLDAPDGGRIAVDGLEVAALPDPARYRREVLGFVFQLHHLILELTAEENVEIPLIPTGLSRAERLARTRSALGRVGLGERTTHRPTELSGGERQRVALARAIVGGPRLLLADEPTGALDSTAAAQTLELLTSLCRGGGTTVLLVSHERDAAQHVDRILRLDDGRIVSEERGGAGSTRGSAPPGAA